MPRRKTYVEAFLEEHEETRDFYIEKFVLDTVTEIRKYMRENSVTQEDLASHMEISQPEVSRLLNYNRNLTLKSLAAIAHALKAEWEQPKLVEPSTKFRNFDNTPTAFTLNHGEMRLAEVTLHSRTKSQKESEHVSNVANAA